MPDYCPTDPENPLSEAFGGMRSTEHALTSAALQKSKRTRDVSMRGLEILSLPLFCLYSVLPEGNTLTDCYATAVYPMQKTSP